MTNKQKNVLAYIFASFSLVLSLVLWTRLIRTVDAAVGFAVLPPEIATSQTAEVRTAREILSAQLSEQIHNAARSKSSIPAEQHSSEPLAVIGVEIAIQPAPATPQEEVEEFTQWDLARKYAISIPSLNINAPVYVPSDTYWKTKQWDLLEEQMQVGLHYGAVAYPHSVAPGRKGALILAGHSSPPTDRAAQSAFGSLFARLPDIREGERIVVNADGASIEYIVDGYEIVSPSDTDILLQDRSESIVKLITCYPVGTTKERLVVTAHRAEM